MEGKFKKTLNLPMENEILFKFFYNDYNLGDKIFRQI